MRTAYFLVGPTATGKTAVANELARRTGAIVLSADSMLVYRGMDIGTAKPAPEELAGIDFRGANLAAPCEEFNAGKWLEAANAAFAEARISKRRIIVAGGTGLYVNALIRGLDAPAPHDPALRAELETLPLPELAARAEKLAPGSVASLSDPQNPRRLIRLIESQNPDEKQRTSADFSCVSAVVAGLDFNGDADSYHRRILDRAQKMFADGLLEETARLRRDNPEFSRTAGKGIGYAEALAVLDGAMTAGEAIAKTALRTRQLAKRQRTWFRRQLTVKWVQSPHAAEDIPRAADEVAAIWKQYGGVEIK